MKFNKNNIQIISLFISAISSFEGGISEVVLILHKIEPIEQIAPKKNEA